MEKRMDTGCMLSGGGDNSPLPNGIGDYSKQIKDLINEVLRLNQKICEQDLRIAKLEKLNNGLFDALQDYVSGRKQSDDSISHTTEPQQARLSDSQGSDEELIMELPKVFVATLRHDIPRANLLIRIIRGSLAPVAMSRKKKKKFRWCHIRYVMEKFRLLEDNINHMDFGRAMEEVMERKVVAGNIRKSGDDDFLKRKDYEEMDDGVYDKEACLEVEYLLHDVIR